MKKIFALSGLFVSILFFFNLNICPIFAAECASGETPSANNCTLSGSTATLPNPLAGSGITNPQTFVGKVIGAALGIVGSLALLMFIYGGFTWMTSAGSPDKVTKGKGIMVWAALGLAVIFSSYALVKFVMDSLK